MTAHEVFRVVCGQGGCSPEYFFGRMSIAEARDYMEGVMMRHRNGWEQTRMLIKALINVMTGEDKDIPLPWDAETESEETTEEDLEELRKKAERMEELMNGKTKCKMESKV